MSTATLPDLFRTLADPTRLRILHALAAGELSVGELAEILGVAQSGVSRHLAALKTSGLVDDRREGTSSLYTIAAEPTDERAGALWPTLREWLADLPHARADQARLQKVLAARRSRDFFRDVAPHWDSMRAAQYGEDLRDLALLELIPRELSVLDVGTGTGFMLVGISPRVARVIGVDASAAMLDQARANLAAAGIANADLRQGRMESLPVENASVDVVLANMALHHAEDPAKAIAEMARVLRPGGRLVLTDLARHPHEWTKDELADEWPGFTPDELRGWLGRVRLHDASVRTVGTCTLTRSRTKEKHEVDVLMATASATSASKEPARRARKSSNATPTRKSASRKA